MAQDKPIPGTSKRGWTEKEWIVEAFASVPPVAAACFTVYTLHTSQNVGNVIGWPITIALWLAIVGVLKVISARRKDKSAEPEQIHDGLRAATVTLHAAIAQICRMTSEESQDHLRVTFHRVVPPLNRSTKIQQIVAYTGKPDHRGTGCGREFSINTGITGKAIRSKEPHVVSFPEGDPNSYLSSLVLELGYTEQQAHELRGGRCSAMAVPVLDRSGQRPLGVIYFDSDLRNLFDDGTTYEAILEVCDGIKSYVSERY